MVDKTSFFNRVRSLVVDGDATPEHKAECDVFLREEVRKYFDRLAVAPKQCFGGIEFTELYSSYWINLNHKLAIKLWTGFTGPIFNRIKPCYLFPLGVQVLPQNSLASGNVEAVEDAIIKLIGGHPQAESSD